MRFLSAIFAFLGYYFFLPFGFFDLLKTGYKTTNKALLLLIIIFLAFGSYYLLNFMDSRIPLLLGENQNINSENNRQFISNVLQTWKYRAVPIPIIIDLTLSKEAISIFYPIVFLIASMGIKNMKQGIISFFGSYLGLCILLVIKNYFYFQVMPEVPNEAIFLLYVSYFYLIIFCFLLILSNFAFSKSDKGLTGLIFSFGYFCGFIILYSFFKHNIKIYDILIYYTFGSSIINYYLIKGKKSIFSIDLKLNNEEDEAKYKVFISYRRVNNSDAARLIRSELNSRNVKTFIDIEDLGSHYFDEQLINIIRNTENFILLLSRNDLTDCIDEDDWLRKEISIAIQHQHNIIPVLKDGFYWDEPVFLPEEIKDLPRHNSIIYSVEYFDAMIIKIISFLENSSGKKLNN